MTTFRLALLSLLATGCFSGTTSTDTSGTDDTADTNDTQDTQDTETGDTQQEADTGTAQVVFHLTGGSDGNARFGIGAVEGTWDDPGEHGIVCDAYYELTSTGNSATPCTNGCDYAFDAELSGGANDGDYCQTLTQQSTGEPATFLAEVTYAQMYEYFPHPGFAFASNIAYPGSSQTYDLENVVYFWNPDPKNLGWGMWGYNFPANGTYPVSGDASSWEVLAGAADSYGDTIYYYFAL